MRCSVVDSQPDRTRKEALLDNVFLAMMAVWNRLLRLGEAEEGFTTAELLGNAALAIGALVVIWALLKAMGVSIVNKIQSDVMNGL